MTVKVIDAAGVAVYEMAGAGTANDAAVRALAKQAMSAAAATVTPGVSVGDLCGDLCGVPEGTLRAEAIVIKRRGATMLVAADVLSGDLRVASFEADALVAA